MGTLFLIGVLCFFRLFHILGLGVSAAKQARQREMGTLFLIGVLPVRNILFRNTFLRHSRNGRVIRGIGEKRLLPCALLAPPGLRRRPFGLLRSLRFLRLLFVGFFRFGRRRGSFVVELQKAFQFQHVFSLGGFFFRHLFHRKLCLQEEIIVSQGEFGYIQSVRLRGIFRAQKILEFRHIKFFVGFFRRHFIAPSDL